MTTFDERLGLPSGSSALEDSLCRGRYQLQKQWNEFCPEPESEPEQEDDGLRFEEVDLDSDREAGRRIHLLYAGKDCPGATQAEIDRAEKARRVDNAIKGQWLSLFDFEPIGKVTEIREKRWWLRDKDGKPVYSGQTDVVWIRDYESQGADILVGDLKGLWGHHDPAPLNMQLRRYIALIAVNMYPRLRSATAYLNQPVRTMAPTITQFEKEDIQKAIEEMYSEVAAIMEPNAKRTAGSVQCHHCRAKLICPEWQQAEARIMKAIVPSAPVAVPLKPEIAIGVMQLPGDSLAKLLAWRPALMDAIELAAEEAKRRLRIDETSVPGWRLWPNSPRSKIDDVEKVWSRVGQFNVDIKEFTKLCSLTKKALTDLIRAKSGLKGTALDLKVGEITDGATKTIPVSPSLERIP